MQCGRVLGAAVAGMGRHCKGLPENTQSVPPMAAGLFSEAGGVAGKFEGQLRGLKPLMAVHCAQRLLRCCYEVLVFTLSCDRGAMYMIN